MDWRHLCFCAAVCLEAGVGFAVPVFLLFFGILYLPLMVATLIRDPSSIPTFLPPVALTVLGTAGIAGVVRVLILLCRRRRQDARRWLTLSAVGCGFVAALLYAASMWSHPPNSWVVGVTIVYLPVVCVLHLVYLARRPLFSIGRGEP
jgi:hypothetical protein